MLHQSKPDLAELSEVAVFRQLLERFNRNVGTF